ncbi:von Willebrand factor A domain-containing protein 8 [Liparis tanakae]|uniref:von Willebrand factor A domain-containing protein 8 n=1 Tax=Liparis tanakae TaxID=230148 RepID=A0A4Z2ERS7_9TELE|nr:von Willebrand factor A domain-containing protein 8 [Liparis tanakae]
MDSWLKDPSGGHGCRLRVGLMHGLQKESPNEVYSFKRPVDLSAMQAAEGGAHTLLRGGLRSSAVKRDNCVSLLSANQVVRALPPSKVPLREVYPKDVTPPMTAAYLEVTDLNSKKVKYIPVPRSATASPYTGWLSKVSESDVLMAALGSGGVVTVDTGGYVRLWETGSDTLQRSLMEWRNMIGSGDGRPIQVNKYRSVDWVKMQPAVPLNTTRGRCYFKNDFHLDVALHTFPCLTDYISAETFLTLCSPECFQPLHLRPGRAGGGYECTGFVPMMQ